MSQIGETVGQARFADVKSCPFCSSKRAEPKFETLELINDGGLLADDMKPMMHVVMDNPSADRTYFIWEDYYISPDQSQVCMNAHHVIPGNASLALVTALLKWMAGTVIFLKHWYDDADVVKRKKAAKAYNPRTEAGDPPRKIRFKLKPSAKGGGATVTRLAMVDRKLVTGILKYELNGKDNGQWLPSNNAVDNWGKIKTMGALDAKGRNRTFAEAYSYNAMHACGWQFHDAHGAYSIQVISELVALATKVAKRAERCKNDCTGSEGATGPHPAPNNLLKALTDVAERIRPLLKLPPDGPKPADPWYTSSLSLKA